MRLPAQRRTLTRSIDATTDLAFQIVGAEMYPKAM